MSKAKRDRLRHQREMELASQEMSKLHSDLSEAYAHFDLTTESGALDACIFEINALRARYNSAIKSYRDRFG